MAHYTIADVNQAPTGLTIEQFRTIGQLLKEYRADVRNADAEEFVKVAMALLDGKLIVFSASDDELPF